MNAGDTKSESSFPVVDGEGCLRAGNVNSAWDMRNQGEGVSEECLVKLDDAFDEDVLPDSAYENSVSAVSELGDEAQFGVNVKFSQLPEKVVTDGFNKYGVRENEDGSIDVRFKVMEPGERKGFEITPQFLDRTASHNYSRIPLQMDHSESQRANVGFVKPGNVEVVDGVLYSQATVPNSGSSIREDIIADFTHDPPLITDISVGFSPSTVELSSPKGSDDLPKFVDAKIKEMSLTPFPAGYDEGGLTPAFSEAVEAIQSEDCDCSDETDESDEEFNEETSGAVALVKYRHDYYR